MWEKRIEPNSGTAHVAKCFPFWHPGIGGFRKENIMPRKNRNTKSIAICPPGLKNLYLYFFLKYKCTTKGHLISKGLFGILKSSKKRTKK